MARRKKSRKGFIAAVCGVSLALLGGIVLLCSYLSDKREPLTHNQILAKDDWTKDELSDTLARMALQRHSRDSARAPKEVYEHLRKQIEKLPKQEQDKLVKNTINITIDKGLAVFRTMERERRKELLERMKKEAVDNRMVAEEIARNPQDLTEEDKKQIEQMKAQSRELVSSSLGEAMVNKMTPEERKEMAPIVKEWVGILEALQ